MCQNTVRSQSQYSRPVNTRRAIFIAALTLSGCTSYHSAPLGDDLSQRDDVRSTLNSPDRAALVVAAGELKHPYLTPLALDFSKPLTPAALGVIAVLANPDLRALRAHENVTKAQVFAARLLPDPSLSLTLEHALRPADTATAYAGSATFDLIGAIATAAVDSQIVNADARQVRLDVAWQEWLIAGQAQLLATRLHYQLAMARLAATADRAAQVIAERTLRIATAGDLPYDELSMAVSAHADTTTRASAAALAAESTRQQLNRTLGLLPHEVIRIADEEPSPALPDDNVEALFAQARVQRLDLRALAAGYASKEAAVHRAVLGQYPRVTIAINRARDNGRVQSIGPTVNFDVPLWNRNRGALATSDAERTALAAEIAARLFATRADIAELVAAIKEDDASSAALLKQLPPLERTAAALTSAARRGDIKLTIAEAQRSVTIDKRLALLALQQASAEQRLALSLALGRPLDSTADTR